MRRYDINAKWDDPFEHLDERRRVPRFKPGSKLVFTISVYDEKRHARLTGPGIILNLCRTGALVVTKHQLEPLQQTEMSIRTDMCPPEMLLPLVFHGEGEVVWIRSLGDRRIHAALRFGIQLSENVEFASFVDFLQTVPEALPAK